jgi:hypothetical protein
MDFQIEAYLNFKRYERNKLLDDSDKYLLADYPISPENLELVKQYRQQLRDYMDLEEVKNYNFNSIIPDFTPFPILK